MKNLASKRSFGLMDSLLSSSLFRSSPLMSVNWKLMKLAQPRPSIGIKWFTINIRVSRKRRSGHNAEFVEKKVDFNGQWPNKDFLPLCPTEWQSFERCKSRYCKIRKDLGRIQDLWIMIDHRLKKCSVLGVNTLAGDLLPLAADMEGKWDEIRWMA